MSQNTSIDNPDDAISSHGTSLEDSKFEKFAELIGGYFDNFQTRLITELTH